jgi:hypothetical protein
MCDYNSICIYHATHLLKGVTTNVVIDVRKVNYVIRNLYTAFGLYLPDRRVFHSLLITLAHVKSLRVLSADLTRTCEEFEYSLFWSHVSQRKVESLRLVFWEVGVTNSATSSSMLYLCYLKLYAARTRSEVQGKHKFTFFLAGYRPIGYNEVVCRKVVRRFCSRAILMTRISVTVDTRSRINARWTELQLPATRSYTISSYTARSITFRMILGTFHATSFVHTSLATTENAPISPLMSTLQHLNAVWFRAESLSHWVAGLTLDARRTLTPVRYRTLRHSI